MPWPIRPVLARETVARQYKNQKIWNDVTEILPTIRTSIIKNFGHTSMLECPNKTAKIYQEFLVKTSSEK